MVLQQSSLGQMTLPMGREARTLLLWSRLSFVMIWGTLRLAPKRETTMFCSSMPVRFTRASQSSMPSLSSSSRLLASPWTMQAAGRRLARRAQVSGFCSTIWTVMPLRRSRWAR